MEYILVSTLQLYLHTELVYTSINIPAAPAYGVYTSINIPAVPAYGVYTSIYIPAVPSYGVSIY